MVLLHICCALFLARAPSKSSAAVSISFPLIPPQSCILGMKKLFTLSTETVESVHCPLKFVRQPLFLTKQEVLRPSAASWVLTRTAQVSVFVKLRFPMTARQKCADKRGRDAEPSFCPFALVGSFLVAKVGIGERQRCGVINRVVT